MMITLYTLVVLKDLGLDPASKQARNMIDRVDKGLVFKPLNNRPFLHGETEPCINGRILGIGAYFKEPNDALAKQLLGEQLEDGGWNCEAPKSRRSSFHTTICVLEGLLEYERAGRKSAAVTKARKRAENYLLDRRMFRSLRTGEVINKRWLRFSFPTFWHYDVLRGLDYLRNAGIKPDSRVDEAIEVVIERRHQNGRWPLNLLHPEQIPLKWRPKSPGQAAGTPCAPSAFCAGTTQINHAEGAPGPSLLGTGEVGSLITQLDSPSTSVPPAHQNGRWPLNHLHPEQIPIDMETAVASASRWNTLRALRVLRWYNSK